MIRLALTYGAVASTGAAAWVGWGQGQGQLAGSVILAAIAFLAVRLWLASDSGLDLSDRLPARDTAASVALAGLIVTAGVAGPMAQPASAQTVTETCDPLDRQVDFLLNPLTAGIDGFECVVDFYSSAQEIDHAQLDAEQTKTDIYSVGKQSRQTAENFRAPFRNYLEDSENAAWSKMQVAVAEAYQNGSSETQARLAAEQAIEDYYSTKERNLIAQYNTHIRAVNYLEDQAQNESNISDFVRVTDTQVSYSSTHDSRYYITLQNDSITLSNGTTTDIQLIEVRNNDNDNIARDHHLTESSGQYKLDKVWIGPPTSSFDKTVAYEHDKYATLWSQIQTNRQNVVSEAKTYVNNTYTAYDTGEINASDVISSQTAMWEYGTSDGSLYNTVGALALSGYDTPSLNGTGTMDIRYQNQTYTGLVMARHVPGGSWTNGTTYNTSNFTGPVFIATTDGTKMDLVDGESFKITEIRNREGSSIGSVNATRYNYKTSNASELAVVTEQLTTLREEIESRESTGGGGGIGFGGSNSYVILIAAGVAVILLLRD